MAVRASASVCGGGIDDDKVMGMFEAVNLAAHAPAGNGRKGKVRGLASQPLLAHLVPLGEGPLRVGIDDGDLAPTTSRPRHREMCRHGGFACAAFLLGYRDDSCYHSTPSASLSMGDFCVMPFLKNPHVARLRGGSSVGHCYESPHIKCLPTFIMMLTERLLADVFRLNTPPTSLKDNVVHLLDIVNETAKNTRY